MFVAIYGPLIKQSHLLAQDFGKTLYAISFRPLSDESASFLKGVVQLLC